LKNIIFVSDLFYRIKNTGIIAIVTAAFAITGKEGKMGQVSKNLYNPPIIAGVCTKSMK